MKSGKLEVSQWVPFVANAMKVVSGRWQTMKPKEKKSLVICVAVILLGVLCLFLNHDSSASDNQYTYHVVNGEAVLGPGAIPQSTRGKVEIPSSIDGYRVTSIGEGAFFFCTNLTAVTIPKSVKDIGEMAFYGCWNLSEVDMPKGVTNIGEQAFVNCSNLTSLKIPKSVNDVGKMAFYGCSRLSEIDIPGSVTNIGEMAFGECESLTSVEMPESVRVIGDEAFFWCTNLVSVKMPSRLSKIGKGVFKKCRNLKSVTMPEQMKRIESFMFYGCERLTSVTIPDSVGSICESAFESCTRLEEVTIPENVGVIEPRAFLSCMNLEEVKFMGKPPRFCWDPGFPFDAQGYYLPSHGAQWKAALDREGTWHGLPMKAESVSSFWFWIVLIVLGIVFGGVKKGKNNEDKDAKE